MKILVIPVICFVIMSLGLVAGITPTFGSSADQDFINVYNPSEYKQTSAYAGWNAPTTNHVINKTDICIFKSFDINMDQSLLGLALEEVKYYHPNVSVKIIERVDQINQNYNCGNIIKLDRGINEQYRFTNYSTKYLISGNTATVFTYVKEWAYNPNIEPLTPMLNWNCELQAHSQKYFSNYNFQLSDQSGKCDPFAGINFSKVGELPLSQVRASIDTVLSGWYR